MFPCYILESNGKRIKPVNKGNTGNLRGSAQGLFAEQTVRTFLTVLFFICYYVIRVVSKFITNRDQLSGCEQEAD